jgi:hypothetical protein
VWGTLTKLILSYWNKTDASGEVQFLIDELENFDPKPIYIHDDETDTYHEIRTTAYKVTLPQGENKTRFSLFH